MLEYIAAFQETFGPLLRLTLINSSYIYIDGWSIVHFCSGAILMTLLFFARLPTRKLRWALLFLLLVIWELFEYYVYAVAQLPYIFAETPADVIFDLIIGCLGAYLIEYVKNY